MDVPIMSVIISKKVVDFTVWGNIEIRKQGNCSFERLCLLASSSFVIISAIVNETPFTQTLFLTNKDLYLKSVNTLGYKSLKGEVTYQGLFGSGHV